jgi:hypothetical protein
MEYATARRTLTEAAKHFAKLDVCYAFMASVKWSDGCVTCPARGGERMGQIWTRRMFKCRDNGCFNQFSVKVGPIFEDTPSVWTGASSRPGGAERSRQEDHAQGVC